jgi:hypothetical protein
MRFLPLLALMAVLASPTWAQTVKAGWIADSKSGCKVWNPYPQPHEAISWSGTCKNGFAQGSGILQWSQSGKPAGRYEGEYRDGKVNVRGAFTAPDGSRYVGEWRDNQRNGEGEQSWPNGDRYQGEYKDDKFDGLGTYTWDDGSRYVGEWQQNRQNGRGAQTWPDGSHYEGEYRDDKAHGQGKYVNVKNDVFEGQWINGCFEEGDRKAAVGVAAAKCGIR